MRKLLVELIVWFLQRAAMLALQALY